MQGLRWLDFTDRGWTGLYEAAQGCAGDWAARDWGWTARAEAGLVAL